MFYTKLLFARPLYCFLMGVTGYCKAPSYAQVKDCKMARNDFQALGRIAVDEASATYT
jgi:hypothetical protein